jgi:hypothetical protein
MQQSIKGVKKITYQNKAGLVKTRPGLNVIKRSNEDRKI